MATIVRRVEYFYATIRDQPGEAYRFLRQLLELGVNLLAFTAIPVGPGHAQLAVFPDDPALMGSVASKAGLALDGPHQAFLVQGDDELGALVSIHEKLSTAGVNVYASAGVTDGHDSFGYIIYVKNEDVPAASAALGM